MKIFTKIFPLILFKQLKKIFSVEGNIYALIALLIPLVLTYISWLNANADTVNDARRSFDSKIRETNQTILKKMQAYEQVLLGGIGLFSASDTVKREEWRVYVDNLLIDKNFPGILGVGYSYSFNHSDSLKIVKTIRQEGFANFKIWPEGIRDEYTSVIYIEPFNERNQRAFGYDLMSEPLRKSAMQKARDNGQTTITGKIRLVRETEYNIQAGFLIFIPLYEKKLEKSSVEERRQLFKGYVYSPFRMRDLMRATLSNDLSNIILQIYDGVDTIPKNLMYSTDSLYLRMDESLFSTTSELNLYGQTWTLKYTALPQFLDSFKTSEPTILLLSGILISLLFSLVTLSFIKTRKTSNKLSGLLESTGEGIFGVNNALECTFINRAALDLLGYRLNQCINKDIHDFIKTVGSNGSVNSADECPIFKAIKSGKVTRGTAEVLKQTSNITFPIDFSVHPVFEKAVVTGSVVTFTDITERKKNLMQIEGSLREKEVLLREIHHRVKNNLQIISSLLNLQVGFSDNIIVNEILEESKNRVKSMALIHEKLYQSKSLSKINIHEFIEELLRYLFNSFGVDSSAIQIELNIKDITLTTDQAVYLGLIVNELVSNSLKYAFKSSANLEMKNHQKKICVEIQKDENNSYVLKIADNGSGFPTDIDFRNTESLGLQLVISLVKQLNGDITLNIDRGTEFVIKFAHPK